RLFDFRPRIGGRGAEGHVARVAEGTVRAQIYPRLGPRVSRGRVQRLTDQRRRSRRALEKGGARVVGEAEQSRGAANRTGHGQKQVGEGGRYMRPEPLLPANAPPSCFDGRRQRALRTCQTPYPSPRRSTRSRTASLDSPPPWSASARYFTAGTSRWMSMRSSSGPETRAR